MAHAEGPVEGPESKAHRGSWATSPSSRSANLLSCLLRLRRAVLVASASLHWHRSDVAGTKAEARPLPAGMDCCEKLLRRTGRHFISSYIAACRTLSHLWTMPNVLCLQQRWHSRFAFARAVYGKIPRPLRPRVEDLDLQR